MGWFRSRREPSDPLVRDLEAAIGPDRVRADGAQRSLVAADASVFDGGVAGPVCFPESTDDVVAIMKIAESTAGPWSHGVPEPDSPVARSRWAARSSCRRCE